MVVATLPISTEYSGTSITRPNTSVNGMHVRRNKGPPGLYLLGMQVLGLARLGVEVLRPTFHVNTSPRSSKTRSGSAKTYIPCEYKSAWTLSPRNASPRSSKTSSGSPKTYIPCEYKS